MTPSRHQAPQLQPVGDPTHPLSVWLRAQTRPDHLDAERQLDLDRRLATPRDLAALLIGWTRVWSQLTEGLNDRYACAQARCELLPAAEQASAWLRADLAELRTLVGVGPWAALEDRPAAAGAPEMPPSVRALGLLRQPAGAWGVAYVLGGTRIGGSVLAPRITSALGLLPGQATRFLSSHGVDTGREWAGFRRRLDASPLDDAQQLRDAARATFAWVAAELSSWLDAAAATRDARIPTPDRAVS